jgi:hypothetical protein
MPAGRARHLWCLMNPEAVSEIELRIAAESKASQYAPPPMVEPYVGGIWGTLFAVGVIALVSNLSRIELGDIPILVTVAISAALPTLHFSSQAKRHRKATLAEFERLKKLNNS